MTETGVKRRLAAIVCADVADYSRLMGVDEAGTLAAMKAHRRELWDPQVTQHGGRIVGTAGDSVLVEFQSAVAAAECALAIQRGMTRRNESRPADTPMMLRIGINVGEVIVDGDDIFGDDVNVTARLQALAPPGGICVSDDVARQVRGKVDAEFVDAGHRELKNIALPVHVWAWPADALEHSDLSLQAIDSLPLPDKPSIAVLPFETLSGDREQEYFGDGIAEDIITALSKINWFFVIARTSSFAYRGTTLDIKEVSTRLGVRYVLEGSVRRDVNRVRVSAQLIDATSGRHVWAERYDRELSDLFALQDEMTQTIVSAIEPEVNLAERERARRKHPETLDVWECYQRGLWHLYRFTRTDFEEAKPLFERAIDLDPDFSLSYGAIALGDVLAYINGYAEATPDAFRETLQAAHQSLALDDRDPWSYLALGFACMMTGDTDTALAEHARAIELNPNFALAHFGLGYAMTLCGREDEAIEELDLAVRLNPHAPYLWGVLTVKAEALLLQGRDEEALDWGRRACRSPNAGHWSYAVTASALGHLGRLEQAARMLEEVYKREPDFTTSSLDEPRHRSNRRGYLRYLEGLLKAGLKSE